MTKNNKILHNAMWIIGCKIVQAILTMLITMLTARYLGPANFGIINYAAALVAFFIPIMQLGLRNVLVQEVVNRPNEEGKILGTAMGMCLSAALFCMLMIFLICSMINRGEHETAVVCILYSVNLLFQALEMIVYWFQAKLLSKYQAVVSLVAYIMVSVYKVILLVIKKGIFWFAISQAIDYMIISMTLIIIYKKVGGQSFEFSYVEAKKMFEKSKFYIVSSLMVTIFAQIDRIMLKLMIGDEATGYYSAAVTCASMTSFIFAAIIDSMRPSIYENKGRDEKKYEDSIIALYNIIIWLALLQNIIITMMAKPVVIVMYGNQYLPAINALRIVVWYTTFSYIGSIRSIWILAENKQKHLWKINMSGIVINVLLNYLLIPRWGILGASFASFVTQVFTNYIISYFIKDIIYNNELICKSINPCKFFNLLKNRMQ